MCNTPDLMENLYYLPFAGITWIISFIPSASVTLLRCTLFCITSHAFPSSYPLIILGNHPFLSLPMAGQHWLAKVICVCVSSFSCNIDTISFLQQLAVEH